MKFAFKAYRADGALETGEIEATTRIEALRALGDRGLMPFLAEPAAAKHFSATQSTAGSARAMPLSLKELAAVARELAVLLKAELPIDTALRLVATSSHSGSSGKFASAVLTDLLAGTAFSVAMQNAAPGSPQIIFSLLKAGEGRGNLAASMDEVAAYLERRVGIAQKVRSALAYPAILTITAVVTVVIIVSVLVPALIPLFEGSGRPPPPALSVAHWVSQQIAEHSMVLAAASLPFVALAGAFLFARRFARPRQNLMLAMPFLSEIKASSEIGAFSRTLGTLLRNGVPMVSAMQTASNVLTTDRFRSAAANATQSTREGRRLADALEETSCFPEMVTRFVAVGEEASRLDDMLLHLASTIEQQLDRRVDKLMTMLGPALTIFIGIMVGGLILSVMQAILSVNEVALK